ncbi:MAG: thioredoxin TrxC [Kangiellaceae bacterium]|nr:thioredoxin TrxC [Kangiellaceae bacterium]
MTDSTKTRLVCGNCSTINQFPSARLADQPKCANCKSQLLVGAPINVDSNGLARHIKQSTLPVLVDFWAPWCGPCQSFAPTFSQLASETVGQMILLKVDTQANQQAAIDFNIRSIPTLALFQAGREIKRMSGALPLPQLKQWISQAR